MKQAALALKGTIKLDTYSTACPQEIRTHHRQYTGRHHAEVAEGLELLENPLVWFFALYFGSFCTLGKYKG